MKLYYIMCLATATKNHHMKSFIGCELIDVFGMNKTMLYATVSNDPFLGIHVTIYDIINAIKADKDVQSLSFKTKEDASNYMKDHPTEFSDNSDPEATWNYTHSILEVEI